MNLKKTLNFLFSNARSRSNSRVRIVRNRSSQKRRLRLESLENREMLSATSWGDDALIPKTETLPVYERSTELEAFASQHNELSDAIDALLLAEGQNPESPTEDFIFGLSSIPTSTYTIYLDFTGHVDSHGTYWQQYGGYGEIVTPAYDFDSNVDSFSNEELKSIYEIWLRVSEDFAPFNVNVTTVEPSLDALIKSDKNDESYGIRVCVGGDGSWVANLCGGIAYVGSFGANSDTPAYIFAGGLNATKYLAEAISHEVGHSLGLSHDGDKNNEYYYGADDWCAIMGAGHYCSLTQWSKGEYVDANNFEDDLAIITSRNGFDYRSDDVGDTITEATSISVDSTGICASGVVERNTDVDFFKFQYDGGALNLKIGGIEGITNLDALVKLYDGSGELVQTFDPSDSTSATVDMEGRTRGTYFLSVEGTGLEIAGKTIYSDYGSLGGYTIVASKVSSQSGDARHRSIPTAPSDLTLGTYDATTRRVSLSWKDNSTNETGFRVEYSTDGGATWLLAQIMDADATSRVAKGVKTNAEYQFRVCALYEDSYSAWTYSETLSTKVELAAPSDLTLGTYDATTRRVSLSWKDNSTNETGFRVEYSTDGGATWLLAQIMDANATSRVATSVQPNAEYQFRVRAIYGNSYSAWACSETLNTKVEIVAPSDLTFGTYDTTSRRVSLSWKDNSTNETGFRVEYSTDGGATWRLAQIMNANATSRVATGVQPNAQYRFRVCAIYGTVYSEWTYSKTLILKY